MIEAAVNHLVKELAVKGARKLTTADGNRALRVVANQAGFPDAFSGYGALVARTANALLGGTLHGSNRLERAK